MSRIGSRLFLAAALSCLILSACSTSDPGPTNDDPVATVGDKSISVTDFERSYIAHLIGSGENDTRGARYLHLQNMIDEVLLASEARTIGLDSDSLYKSFHERTRRKSIGARFFETSVENTIEDLTEEDLRAAFVKSKEKPIVRHLFYRVKAEADAAHSRLLDGVPFLDEAQHCYNTAAFDSSAGYLGPISYFNVDDTFAEVAFALGQGEFSEPVRSRVGYHIILVEDRVRNPLLTESEFQTRKQGLTEQMQIRQRRMKGDAFVRDYMTDLDVVVNPEGVAALRLAIQTIENRANDTPVQIQEGVEAAAFDLGALAESFSPDTELLTYNYEGDQLTFTAGEYYFWLRDLPFAEAANRTGASVGRALRNEVLAMAGVDAGLESDPIVEHDVDINTRRYLASALRLHLSSLPANEPQEDLVREAFKRTGLEGMTTWSGVFHVRRFADYATAQGFIEQHRENPSSGVSRAGWERVASADFTASEPWGRHAARIPAGEMGAAVLSDGTVGVLFVEERTGVQARYEDYRSQLTQSIRPYVNEYETINRLRDEASVSVDTTLFELIMDLDDRSAS